MNIQTIKTKIPHGGYNEISKRAKVNKITICNFFNGKKSVSPQMETKILKDTAQYLQDLKDQKTELLNQINNL